jgi:hypothetical protein
MQSTIYIYIYIDNFNYELLMDINDNNVINPAQYDKTKKIFVGLYSYFLLQHHLKFKANKLIKYVKQNYFNLKINNILHVF